MGGRRGLQRHQHPTGVVFVELGRVGCWGATRLLRVIGHPLEVRCGLASRVSAAVSNQGLVGAAVRAPWRCFFSLRQRYVYFYFSGAGWWLVLLCEASPCPAGWVDFRPR